MIFWVNIDWSTWLELPMQIQRRPNVHIHCWFFLFENMNIHTIKTKLWVRVRWLKIQIFRRSEVNQHFVPRLKTQKLTGSRVSEGLSCCRHSFREAPLMTKTQCIVIVTASIWALHSNWHSGAQFFRADLSKFFKSPFWRYISNTKHPGKP